MDEDLEVFMKSKGKKFILYNATYMSYKGGVIFEDYLGKKIQLSEDTWEHIREGHPEVPIEDIKWALEDPDEVRRSNSNPEVVRLYYRLREALKGKVRFRVVVVKLLNEGNYIITAYTSSSIKLGDEVFKKQRGES